MNSMIERISLAMIVAAMLVSRSLGAAPEHPVFDDTGVVDSVDAGSRSMVVNDQTRRFDAGLLVHDIQGNTSVGAARLKPGMAVGFVQTMKADRPFVGEIWILESVPIMDGAEEH